MDSTVHQYEQEVAKLKEKLQLLEKDNNILIVRKLWYRLKQYLSHLSVCLSLSGVEFDCMVAKQGVIMPYIWFNQHCHLENERASKPYGDSILLPAALHATVPSITLWRLPPFKQKIIFSNIYPFIPDVTIAPLQVHYYSEALPLLLRVAPNYSIDTVLELTCRRVYRQLSE